jgi:hypothetical protein
MHTDQTLGLLKDVTTLLGVKFRHFVNHTCRQFNTHELQREANARARRAAKRSATSSAQNQAGGGLSTLAAVPGVAPEHHALPTHLTTGLGQINADICNTPTGVEVGPASAYAATTHAMPDLVATRRAKSFNLNTYKYHLLGDYVEQIRQYGTTDSYTTKLVHCMQHTPLTIS